jgi:hypothetical protein
MCDGRRDIDEIVTEMRSAFDPDDVDDVTRGVREIISLFASAGLLAAPMPPAAPSMP